MGRSMPLAGGSTERSCIMGVVGAPASRVHGNDARSYRSEPTGEYLREARCE